MYYLFASIALALFWLILSGHFSILLLSFGVVSVLLVVWFLRRMDRADREPNTLYPTPSLLAYVGWLLWQVVKANVDLARRIWHPKLPIDPNWSRLDIDMRSPLQKTLYANSITLTPGTLTTDVNEDHFMIHALSHEGMEDLRRGEMERRIRKLDL